MRQRAVGDSGQWIARRHLHLRVLLVEQNARSALKIADRVYVLESGRVTMQGPAAELAQDARVIEAYLGS